MAESNLESALANAVAACCPEAIGISIRNVDDQVSSAPRFLLEQARTIVALCKSLSSAPVILGGAGYSMFPESALDYLGADMGIQGEGEGAFTFLLEKLEKGEDTKEVPGLYLKGKGCGTARTFQLRLDDWPMPDPKMFADLEFKDSSLYLPFQTRRGCPLDCSYCATSAIEGRRIRMRSPETVVKELARWRTAGYSRIYFVDNTFNIPANYAQNLCKQISRNDLDIEWRAIFYPCRTDQALIQVMAQAGCTDVSMGFESGSDRVLAGMGKRYSVDDVRQASELLGEAGISRMGFLLLGGPEETEDSVMQSLQFVDSLNLEAMKLTVGIRIYPFTPLAEIAINSGIIKADDDLLQPRFYLNSQLEPWLSRTLSQWLADRPNWKM
jgi:radical SAM superfamily enzyme YgiQ (UPF0313 family)